MGINLIFPVAGEAVRFGGTFKPFLKIGDVSFIETTFEPFKKWIENINKIYFICTAEQEKVYSVSSKIKEKLPYDCVEVIVIPKKTKGPYQTLSKGIMLADIKGESIVCDCDHSLNVDEIFKHALKNEHDCIIPTWEITKDEWMNWSKVVLDKDSNIKMICEKERISSDDYNVKGIIGCIYFKDIQNNFKKDHIYVSDSLQELLKQDKKIKVTSTKSASFYGDVKMLENHVNNLRKKCSIFCDIDGVLIYHDPHSTSDIETNKPIQGFENLGKLKSLGHKIILTTARSEKYRDKTIDLLSKIGIEYNELVMGLPAGPRLLINDHKPSKIFTNQANSLELIRDKGIKNLEISKYYKESDTEILKTFDGGSFAKTYLLSNNIVRKHIIKQKDDIVHYDKLKRQVSDLERFSFLWPDSTPKITKQKDTDFDFSFDMEYLKQHKTVADISCLDEKKLAINNLLDGMNKNVYSLRKEVDGISWLTKHYQNKIFSKFDSYCKDLNLNKIIFNEFIYINNVKYLGLNNTLLAIDKHLVKPNFIRPIHGDFTLENVMWDGSSIKLIDMDGSDIFDAAELDLGKMCQSIFSKFNEWKNIDINISKNDDQFECIDKYFKLDLDNQLTNDIISQWSVILNDDRDTVINKGIFYMSMYFIRFVPFRMKVSSDHGIFALLMAIVWLNKLIKNES